MSESAVSHPAMIDVRELKVEFHAPGKRIQAVNGVDLEVGQGEVLALIGESGSGKSVTLRALMRLHNEATTRYAGQARIAGQDLLALKPRQLAGLRGKTIAMIFQEPLLALDPVYSVGQQIVEAIRQHERLSPGAARARALELFQKVGIPSPERRLDAYPHELSGGMRQRAMIALALACQPRVLLADEPTTALDATVQIQVLLLLRQLQQELGLSIVFVTHDIGAAAEVADRMAVMYAGRIVEQGSSAQILSQPRHPYTQALLKSRSHGAMRKGSRLETIGGAPPDLSRLPPGCAFAERCPHAQPLCQQQSPAMQALDGRATGPGHSARCLRLSELPPLNLKQLDVSLAAA
jgi:peptide/nickel transport system ATP-binding protein